MKETSNDSGVNQPHNHEHEDHEHLHEQGSELQHDHSHEHSSTTTTVALPVSSTVNEVASTHPHPHHDHDEHEHDDHDDHQHDHPHEHEHEHDHPHGFWGALRSLLPFGQHHSHDAADSLDDALAGSAEGIRAVKISLAGLGVTAILQFAVVLLSGSVALLADSIHNISDAGTAIPLWLAFSLSRKPPTRRYTYGYGRAEDIAGVFVVLMITISTIVAAWVALDRLFNPRPITDLEWVAVAAVIGFIGNEIVARYRIQAGERIGSAALVADGYHARTDGFTSLAVLLGAIGVWLGFPLADPIIGLFISVAIMFVLKDAAVQIWRRLMDAVDPQIITDVEQAAQHTQGVQAVSQVQARWIGHSIYIEARITANHDLSLSEAHDIAEEARHNILHQVRKVSDVIIHVDPAFVDGFNPHEKLLHHIHH